MPEKDNQAVTLYTQMTEEKAKLFIDKVIAAITEDDALKALLPRIECPKFQEMIR